MSDAGSDAGSIASRHVAQPELPEDDASRCSDCKSTEHEPQLTFRISVKHVAEVLKGFTEFKKCLVNKIGFTGILKLSLKFSAWAMNKVDVHPRAICINENKILRFWVEDIHKVSVSPAATVM
jgi:hypothetical protein